MLKKILKILKLKAENAIYKGFYDACFNSCIINFFMDNLVNEKNFLIKRSDPEFEIKLITALHMHLLKIKDWRCDTFKSYFISVSCN